MMKQIMPSLDRQEQIVSRLAPLASIIPVKAAPVASAGSGGYDAGDEDEYCEEPTLRKTSVPRDNVFHVSPLMSTRPMMLIMGPGTFPSISKA